MQRLHKLSKIATLQRLNKVSSLYFSTYAQKMHESWLKDPNSVHKDWDIYFKNGAQIVESTSSEIDPKQMDKLNDLAISTYLLIRYYKHRGHELSALDPLSTQLKYIQILKIYKSLENTMLKIHYNLILKIT